MQALIAVMTSLGMRPLATSAHIPSVRTAVTEPGDTCTPDAGRVNALGLYAATRAGDTAAAPTIPPPTHPHPDETSPSGRNASSHTNTSSHTKEQNP
ncbi:hypothetical protein [Streptomyces endophyticus]|uniref:Uncharacterized protein n=1 Tax=Streptomyces endophyticus TaxID=714166 RepID=A0ABU6F0I9_9ACTN|nr:hypothetical protein [Streptomyces endophyticus]MEB8336960.1 hypothetical protein [Streptomyces endophyticus]